MAFFGVSLGIWLTSLVGALPLRWLGLNPDTSLLGLAVGKVSEVLPIVAAILLVNRLEGGTPGRLLLRKGQLGLSLALGLALGAVLFALFLAMGGWEAIAYVGARAAACRNPAHPRVCPVQRLYGGVVVSGLVPAPFPGGARSGALRWPLPRWHLARCTAPPTTRPAPSYFSM